MSRRVAVELVLEAAKYLFGIRNVAAETKAAAEAVHGLDNKVDTAGRSLDEFAVSIIAGKKELEGFGDHAKEAGLDLELLDQRIDATKRKLALLALEFAATGDAATGKRFKDQHGMLSKLEALRKELEGGSLAPERRVFELLIDEAAPAGMKAGNNFIKQFSTALDGTPIKSVLIGSLVAAAVVAAAPVGAAVAGAITGAIGVGGIAGGIFAASKDAAVRSAAQEFGGWLSEEFFSGGSSFVEPIRESLAILKTDVVKLDLGHIFEPAASSVTLLATGIGDFVDRFEPGFEQALKNSGPFISAMADGLGEVGDAFGQFMDDVSRNHGEIEGLRFLFGAVDVTVRILGKSLEFLGAMFHVANVVFLKMVDAARAVATALHLPHADLDRLHDMLEANINSGTQLIPVVDGMGDAFAGSSEKIDEHLQALKDDQKAIDDWVNNALAMSDANIAVAQDFADLNDKLVHGKKNWDLNSQAGRDNQRMINSTIDDLERQRKQAIETSDGSQAAIDAINRKFNDQIGLLEQAAIKAGDTKKAFEDMAGTYRITIITDILTAAAAARASKTDKDAKFTGRASGGPLDAFTPYIFGEHGPEIGMFAQPGHMLSNSQSSAMAQQWGAAPAGSGPIVVQNEITLLDPMTGQRTRAILITEATSRGVPQDVAKASYP